MAAEPPPQDTRSFLEQRFARDAAGNYHAHQPVRGIGRGSEPGELLRVARTLRLLRWLEALEPQSLADLGAAEGYIANLVRLQHDCPVLCCDLSLEACRRAGEIYGLPAVACSVESLPLRDKCADVSVLSEVFEHLPRPLEALAECLRVTRRFLLFSTQELCASRAEQSIRLALRELDAPHTEFNFLCRGDLRALFGKHVAMLPQFRRSLRRSASDVDPPTLWTMYAIWLASVQGWRASEGIIAVISVGGEPIPKMRLSFDPHKSQMLVEGPPVAQACDPPWDWLAQNIAQPAPGELTVDARDYRRPEALSPHGLGMPLPFCPQPMQPGAASCLARRLQPGPELPDARRRLLSALLRTMERIGWLTGSDHWSVKRDWLRRSAGKLSRR